MLPGFAVSFHFVFKEALKERLTHLACKLRIPRNDLVMEICNYAEPILTRYQCCLYDEENAREFLSADTDMHVRMHYRIKRKILLLRATCNVWSMAIIVRRILYIFLILEARYGFEGAFKILKEVGVREKKNRKNFYKKEQHMSSVYNPRPIFSLEFCRFNITQTLRFIE